MKEQLITAPVLICPDFSLPFTIQTDASGYGIGAVLTQQHPDGEKVICYLSRSLTKNERNYSTTERECLAVLWAIEKQALCRRYEIFVITDHHSLVWLNRLQSPTGRLARWSVKLQQFDYEILHRRGKENVVPDTFSRSVPVIDCVQTNDTPIDKRYTNMIDRVASKPNKYPSWQMLSNKLYKNIKYPFPLVAVPTEN